MARDAMVTGAMIVAFAILMTAHLVLVVALAGQRPRWKAAVALAVPPLAPFWGLRARAASMKVCSTIWVGSAVAYAALRWAGA
jgi:hypothetical protein